MCDKDLASSLCKENRIELKWSVFAETEMWGQTWSKKEANRILTGFAVWAPGPRKLGSAAGSPEICKCVT